MYNYDRNLVLIAFRAINPRDRDPDESTLVEFDEQLFDDLDKEIRRQAPDRGIPLGPFTRSCLAVFAYLSEAKSDKTRVKHACEFFRAVRPQPPLAALASRDTPVSDGGGADGG